MNLDIYNRFREVPKEAQKTIIGGRLTGMTDINPMWRIKSLTEQFGACGVGWYTEIVEKWLETSMATDEISANILINLYIKTGDEWSKPIQGIGGSMFVSKEKAGMYTDDECFKKAYTDAISVACKALGFGADIYWQGDRTKYSEKAQEPVVNDKETALKELIALFKARQVPKDMQGKICKMYNINAKSTAEEYRTAIAKISKTEDLESLVNGVSNSFVEIGE